jgi:hypothetical protein
MLQHCLMPLATMNEKLKQESWTDKMSISFRPSQSMHMRCLYPSCHAQSNTYIRNNLVKLNHIYRHPFKGQNQCWRLQHEWRLVKTSQGKSSPANMERLLQTRPGDLGSVWLGCGCEKSCCGL